MAVCVQDDVIVPVRKALEYYTEMQQALEEEKKRKEMNEKSDKHSTHNGLKMATSDRTDSARSRSALKSSAKQNGKIKW